METEGFYMAEKRWRTWETVGLLVVLAAGNLLLYEAALWGVAHGVSKLHLGGGMAPEDSLFGFKKQFNKNGRREFWVGRSIFDPAAYQELLALRKSADPAFDPDNGFMIQYRR